MINAKELRIGNLVEYRITDKLDERKEWWEVSEIDADDIHWLSKVDTKDEDFRAIPLTEEWLLMFGFKKRKNRHLFHWENKIVVSEYKDEFENFFYPKTGYDIRFSNEIKYVHQLQNLYFALIQEELKIK